MKKQSQSGYVAVVLLVFVTVATVVAAASVSLNVIALQSGTEASFAAQALTIAESGSENAVLRLLRDPSYTGETLVVADGQAVTTVIGTSPQTIRTVGTLDNFSRTIEVQVDRVGGVLSVLSWQEVYN